jgi:hypothetical protein
VPLLSSTVPAGQAAHSLLTQLPLQHGGGPPPEPQMAPEGRHTGRHWPSWQVKSPQHSLSALQTWLPDAQQVPPSHTLRPQHSLSSVQGPLPSGMHIGVVEVEVVLVDVEVVGVSVVEVVLVVVGAAVVVVVVVPHGPRRSPWRTWLATALWETSMVFSSGVSGLWQMITFCCWASAREGISAAMAVPAKSLSARRRLIDPSASALARSSKERLVDSWLTCCPLFPKGGTLGD